MGFVSGIDDFVFPPGQAFRFGSLDFITNDFGKISLLDSDPNQSGGGQVSAPFGIPNSAEIYSKIISTESASNQSDEIQSTSTRPDQDNGAYPSILMSLPDDLATVFTTRASSSRRPRPDPASASIQPSSREVGVILQRLGTVSTEELYGFLSSPGVDSRPTEIVEYDYFDYHYDYRNLDNFDEGHEDNYAPLFFGVFMADNDTEEQRQAREAEEQHVRQEAERRRLEEERQAQERERLQREQQEHERATKEAEDRRQRALEAGRRARELIGQQDVEGTAVFRTPQQNAVAAITLLDTLLKEDALNQANHVVNILNQIKTMIVASVPVNSASVRTPTGSRVPPLRSQDYHQPSLSVVGAGSSRRSRDHGERYVHSPPDRHRERRAEQPRSPRRSRPVDLCETINQRRTARGYIPHHSLDHYDDDVDGDAAFTSDLRRVDWPTGFKPTGIENKAMANYLPVALADSARSWLHGLSRGTIGSWAELRDHFIANFQGTFERPDYIRRFSEQHNKISDITDDVIIAAFTKGIRHELLVGKPPRTVKQMFEKANEYAKAEDVVTASKQSGTTWKPKKDTPTTRGSGSTNYKDRKQQYAKNSSKPTDGVQSTSKKKDDEDDAPTGFQDSRKELNHIFGGPLAYEYLVVRNVKLRRSLIDGGSALNILFAKTLDDMQIPRTELKPSNAPFHGVIPGLSSTPLDQITLPVTFGTWENFRTKNICFEVVDFETAYHAILERPVLAKFLAVPHYTYMMMKMPGLATRKAARWPRPARLRSLERKSDWLHPQQPKEKEVIEHSLHVKEDAKPIKQRLRCFAQDRKDAIKEELTKLLATGFIKEVLHPDWLANLVLVLKKTGQWRMCVDYTDLNKSCPKDPFGLPRIDQVVDSTAGCELLSFLDCYSGYHQIHLKESNYLKTSFITPFGAYCYITMPFGLKNAGATYQRMIQRCFSTQIGRNVEAYVDDVVVKTKQRDDLIADLEETFASICFFKMKLNPKKCIFGVTSGKLLGFMASHRGIQANSEKINAILNMKPPSSQNDVQKLTGCMVALSWFVSRLGEWGMLFFKLPKKADNFQWGPESQKAFEDFKKLLTTPPVLSSPHPQEPLLLYVSTTSQVVSMVLVVEREDDGHV
uniref:Gag-pol protein n=1 Tax=Oryza sativa subsp. japonica TaxID=39947 RepID=Q84T42_ORYSJ|nr:putative gag-pol protein [Oryza sativa Japonica Group]